MSRIPPMLKTRIWALVVIVLALASIYFVLKTEPKLAHVSGRIPTVGFLKDADGNPRHQFKLGLDLSGGTHLVYRADVSKIDPSDVHDLMSSLRDVIERRINVYGVSEPVIQVEEGGLGATDAHRLSVDLPGITDIKEATALIGQTPLLEFKVEGEQVVTPDKDGKISVSAETKYVSTKLTGQYLKHASLQFNSQTSAPTINLEFNKEGADLFQQITKENVGKTVAIYLDGAILSAPTVQQEISGGQAVITGSFTPAEAKALVGRLNSGALPVPIELVSTQTIGPILGERAVTAGAHAAAIGFLAIALFLILWYRLPGLVAVVALGVYVGIVLTFFKLIPVTLTAAGIAGFIISLGIAVDANVLIFERTKEELRAGRAIRDAIKAGFHRAWTSIRDSNYSSLITAVILFWFGTSLIKGFALTFMIGVLVSLFSSMVVVRLFLLSLPLAKEGKVKRFLFSSGVTK